MSDLTVEQPFSDSGCVKKYVVNTLWWNGWDWQFEFRPRFAGHSKNWSMGSLNIDLFSICVSVGPIEWFFSWRLMVLPPKPSVSLSDAFAAVVNEWSEK